VTDDLSAEEIEALLRKHRLERDKRLRSDGTAQYAAASEAFAEFGGDPYEPQPADRAPVRREVEVMVLGAGMAGLLVSTALIDAGVSDLLILDQAGGFGGVWYWNRYPGIRCDVEAYIYLPLLEKIGTVSSERYASGPEIRRHADAVASAYGLRQRALFHTVITEIAWDEARGRWLVRTNRSDEIRARFIMLGSGPLHRAKIPDIPGLAGFRGAAFHSSRWNYSVTGGDSSGGLTKLKGKRVALIGTGASSVQILPHLARSGARVLVFQRTPGAVAARGNRPTDLEWFRGQDRGWQRERMDNFTRVITGDRAVEDLVDDGWTDLWTRLLPPEWDRANADQIQRAEILKMTEIRARIDDIVIDPATADSLKPWYGYYCKRPLFSDDYYQSFNCENVTLVDTDGASIERIHPQGLEVRGQIHEADVIIFGTGFDLAPYTNETGGYALRGRGGIELSAHWRDGMRSLHGIMTSRFPNMFLVGTIEQAATSFNYPYVTGAQARHIAEIVAKLRRADVVVAEVTADAERRWAVALADAFVDRSATEAECTPSYFNNEGRVDGSRPTLAAAQYGGGPLGYLHRLETWRRTEVERDLSITFAQGVSRSTASRH
jgi:cyclohexanone monooxygenase